MKLIEIITKRKLDDKTILKKLDRHRQEIEYEENRQKSTFNMGIGRTDDLVNILSLYNTGNEQDAVMADDLLDIVYNRISPRRLKRSERIKRTTHRVTADSNDTAPDGNRRTDGKGRTGLQPSKTSADRVDKLANKSIRSQN
ncbi:hypothetical protein Q6D67_13470 [Haliea sp. E1-2-M8]|uniref:hypothetical protein n=1 Tax=Haliea sp. E1-2-M8 TaxID=3064706 RepID=UPI0027204D38|nr:hypothetical protein [Haliea sp. E1-2-M8]MDO8862714.1 hypothetical protein [Haliea sp. E1-2-M8]